MPASLRVLIIFLLSSALAGCDASEAQSAALDARRVDACIAAHYPFGVPSASDTDEEAFNQLAIERISLSCNEWVYSCDRRSRSDSVELEAGRVENCVESYVAAVQIDNIETARVVLASARGDCIRWVYSCSRADRD